MNSNQFEFVGLVAGTKFWSLQLDFEAVHTMRVVPATSRIACADLNANELTVGIMYNFEKNSVVPNLLACFY